MALKHINARYQDSEVFSPAYLITVTSSSHGSVVARLPQEVSFQIRSDWQAAIAGEPFGHTANIVAGEISGYSLKTQRMTAQTWLGNSPLEITLPLDFQAEINSQLEVVDPIIRLCQMALPKPGGNTGIGGESFIQPGPRIFGIADNANDTIIIKIGKFIQFSKVIIVNVSPVYKTQDMSKDHKPLRASCSMTFRSMFTLTSSDFAHQFIK